MENEAGRLETSESTGQLIGALAAFHADCPVILKENENPFLKSKYADLASILTVINPHLSKVKLAVLQFPLPDGFLCTRLAHESGEWMQSTYQLQPAKKGDAQAMGSAITYQRRYALAAILSLSIDDDDDGAAAAKGGKSGSNPEKLRANIGTLVRKVGKDKVVKLLSDSNGRFLQDNKQPVTKISDITCVSSEDTLNAIYKFIMESTKPEGAAL